jgi:hypothetical protein
MIAKHRICTFVFRGGTEIRVAVKGIKVNGREVREKTFEEFIAEAKEIGWYDDETHGRGEVVSFEVGKAIFVEEERR